MLRSKLPGIFVLLVLLAGVNSSAVQAQQAHAKWTVMVYMAANNNLEPDSIINLMEMSAIGSTPDVNIVAQVTRPPDYKGIYGEWGGTRRFLITKSDGGPSRGDFQISQKRLDALVQQQASASGLSTDAVNKFIAEPASQKEKDALSLTVPPINPNLAPLQLQDVQDLGSNVNSGSAQTLTDFGEWAVKNYPADHYGLILWDHGGGWSMVASDDTLGRAGIPMPDLQKALAAITGAAGAKLEFIGFDACLMGQVPVLATTAPYAKIQIASEELVPGFGWDYMPILQALTTHPDTAPVDLGKTETDGFAALYAGPAADSTQSYSMSVFDLSQVDSLVHALDAFDAAVKASGQDQTKVIATARANAQAFGVLGQNSDSANSVASVDLPDLMRLIGTLTQDAGVKTAAQAVIAAAKKTVLYQKASKTLAHATGVSVFFPTTAAIFSEADGDRYRTEFGGTLASWQGFMDSFYHLANAAPAALTIHVTALTPTDKPGSIQDNPVISYDLNGKNILDVQAYVLYKVEDQENVLLDNITVDQNFTAADGSQINDFPDGQSHNDFYWDVKVPSLTDGQNNLLVLMQNNPSDQQHGFISGLFTNSQTGKVDNASLLVDLETLQATGVWLIQNTGSAGQAVAEARPKPGDIFEPVYRLIDQQGAAQDVPSGTKFTFSPHPLKIDYVPAPDGQYTLVLKAADAASNQALDSTTLNVKNAGLDTSFQGFKDMSFGVQFLYPWAWTEVDTFTDENGNDGLYVSNVAGDTSLSIVNYNDLNSQAEVDGRVQDHLASITGVQVGSSAAVQVGKYPGTQTSYQYTDSEGNAISGLIASTYVPDTKQGYVFYIEGPATTASDAAAVLKNALSSAQFFQPSN